MEYISSVYMLMTKPYNLPPENVSQINTFLNVILSVPSSEIGHRVF